MELLLILEPFFSLVSIVCFAGIFVLLICAIVLVASYSDRESAGRAAIRLMLKRGCFLFALVVVIGGASYTLSKPMDIYANIIMYRAVSQKLSGAPTKTVASNVHFLE